jgi:hypothetical protein
MKREQEQVTPAPAQQPKQAELTPLPVEAMPELACSLEEICQDFELAPSYQRKRAGTGRSRRKAGG